MYLEKTQKTQKAKLKKKHSKNKNKEKKKKRKKKELMLCQCDQCDQYKLCMLQKENIYQMANQNVSEMFRLTRPEVLIYIKAPKNYLSLTTIRKQKKIDHSWRVKQGI